MHCSGLYCKRSLFGAVCKWKQTCMDFLRIIIAILLPPLGVFLKVGFAGAFWLNVLLTFCFWIPGMVHAVYIIAKR